MSHDPPQTIAPLANAEFALNRVPVTDILMLLKLGSPGLLFIFGRPSQRRPGELDPAFLAPCKCFPVPVDFVGQHAFGVETIGGSVRLDSGEKVCRFVERIEGQPHNPGIAFTMLRCSFGPNSVFAWAFPRTIGLTHGRAILTILSGTECLLFSYMYSCCS